MKFKKPVIKAEEKRMALPISEQKKKEIHKQLNKYAK